MSARIGRVFSVTVTTALYRRYRPDSFADVIGQEHVTEPLMTALRKNRVNHAYLFSGPRGCGKTTSARILARCLNCAEGPTDIPCGRCPSCIELARGGSGSLDVIEIDAASHGGVDDARDLRERATFAPVRDRYKIFIIDEAHMVTSAGFNALLKIVEEPPEHIKFIFATTEPDKVIGTIRSRTHHYPFRLVPPEPLMAYLELLCQQENVPVAPGVLSLVIRAGGGSVRDSLSVLDQLMAGAGPNGLDYELAVALLGYTHASLLDDVVDALAASDAATVFRAVDRVIQTGHDPRRFVEDLLERFRDLIIVKAMPESAQAILRGMPADQIARLQAQAHNLGSAELSRAADVTNTALTEMTGATSPRLHLELLCARILLPSSEQNERGLAARIDRVERRFNYAGNDVGAPAAQTAEAPAAGKAAGTSGPPQPHAPSAEPAQPAENGPATDAPRREAPAAAAGTASGGPGRASITPPRVSTSDWPVEDSSPARPPAERPAPAGPGAGSAGNAREPAARERTAPASAAQQASARLEPHAVSGAEASGPAHQAGTAAGGQIAAAPEQPAAAPPGMGDVEVLRRAWPDVLQTLARIKRSTWALVEPNAQVASFDGTVLTLSFTTPGLAGAFGRADHSENLRQAVHKTVGIDCQINAVAGGASQSSSEPNPKAPASPPAAAATSADVAWGLAPAPAPAATNAPAQAPASVQVKAPVQSAARVQAAPAPAAREEAAAPQARSGAVPPSPVRMQSSNSYPDPGGDYSYSDDDWGPPRDEDAPPLDEEPPADWEPSSAESGTRLPAAGRNTDALGGRSQQGGRMQEVAAPEPAPPAPAAPGRAGANETVHDPWSRAVEQSPGVWLVGTESNVGRHATVAAIAGEAAGPSTTAHYEPATAQVPPSIPVTSLGAAIEPDWGPAPNGAASPGPGPACAPQPEPAQVRAPEYAMASAAPVAGPAAAPPTRPAPPVPPAPAPSMAGASAPAAAPVAASNSARQSLYQRLTNSPEAEAGRAKAPARTATAADSYVQDIPSADDETIEESGVFGRAAVERILGGKLIEERAADGSPLPPRY
ncbi:DNA polymerase III subunit gamma and tau [Pseudarthrobacter sp. NamE2]|uniref:DNA polymerase III subunit gamma and tau n=1 Tax=Pseudarthrobacter sp. NamE2 TaxID=2576838 RepID=UPI0010FDEC71|nr:DNA polymerase III subunit gamma and tau [Pseudarthrobacter sp. NamE2]TLM82209.1 DNA polymerase III subunit gamma and tau [Pseudarthrobacter sp. NamE2]